MVSPGLSTRWARLGASFQRYFVVDSTLPHFVLAKSTYSISSGPVFLDRVSGLSLLTSANVPITHPAGTSPSSEFSKRLGNRSASTLDTPGSRPSAFARTGSKSTNQDLKMTRAIASSVLFMRRFNSILSSSVPRTSAMARCSGSGGIDSRNFGMSAHFRLSKTAPTLMNFPTCSHQSAVRTSQRRKNYVVGLRVCLARPLDEVLTADAPNLGRVDATVPYLRDSHVGIATVSRRRRPVFAIN